MPTWTLGFATMVLQSKLITLLMRDEDFHNAEAVEGGQYVLFQIGQCSTLSLHCGN